MMMPMDPGRPAHSRSLAQTAADSSSLRRSGQASTPAEALIPGAGMTSISTPAAASAAVRSRIRGVRSSKPTNDRLSEAFPAKQQSQIRSTLADSISAIVSQQLLPAADGNGRCAAHEILLRTNSLANLIREGNTTQLVSLIQGGRNRGMALMDDSLADLVKSGTISSEVAMTKAHDKERFE